MAWRTFWELERLLSLARIAGAEAWLFVIAMGLCLFGAGFAHVAARRARSRRARVLGVGAPCLLTLGVTVALGLRLAARRAAFLDELRRPLGEVHRFYGESLEEALLVPLLALAIPICVLAVARTLRRTRWGLLAAVPWVVAAGAYGGALEQLAWHHARAAPERAAHASMFVAELDDARLLVVIAGLAAFGAGLLVGPRRGSLPLAALVFVAGASLFAATRGHAADARSGVSLLSLRPPLALRLPPPALDARCEPTQPGSLLELHADGGVSLDGVRVRDERALEERLDRMARHWAVRHPRGPFVAVLHVVAKREGAERWRAAAARVGWTDSARLYARVEHVQTATLGPVRVERPCASLR